MSRTILKHRSPIIAVILAIVLSWSLVAAPKAHALAASDWQAGNIVSDDVFFNATSMTADQIQNFLNAKVPTCDTSGSQIYSGSTTRAQYSATQGHTAPFTCLKDYHQNTPTMAAESGLCGTYNGGAKSSAQLIHDVAVACGINPQVLLVLLQKEQSLVTDDWPWDSQYQSATGFGCPDTAPCDASYGGFFYQVYYAARQFKVYQQNASSYNYRAGRNNTVLFNPTSSCGSSSVYIQNQATANLYIYTPYQPDAAALNNLYGTGDSCSAYGNRNFWRLFSDWFGPTTDADSVFSVTSSNPVTGANVWYLVTPTGRYVIPSMEVYNAWGLNKYSFQTVDPGYFSSLPDGGTLGRSLKDKYGNYFFVDGGEKHYIRDSSYRSLWGLDSGSTVQSTGLVYALNGGTWVGRFMEDTSTNQMWLMDGGIKHAIASGPLLYQWGYVGDQLTTVSPGYLATLTDGGAASRFVSAGGNKYLVDSGRAVTLTSSGVQDAFNPGGSFLSLTAGTTLSYLPQAGGGIFTQNAANGVWFMLEGGKRHQVSNVDSIRNWGYTPGTGLLTLSDDFVAGLPDGGPLAYSVKTSDGTMWAVDGSKHQIPSAMASSWLVGGAALPTYSTASLGMLPAGQPIATYIKPSAAAFVYMMDGGAKRYLSTPAAANAWGAIDPAIVPLNATLVDLIPESYPASSLIQNSGNTYLLDNGSAHLIASAYVSDWTSGQVVTPISDARFANITLSATQITNHIQVNGIYYLVSQGRAITVTTHRDAYGLTDVNSVELSDVHLPISSDISYLVRSSDAADARMWLVSEASKILLPSFPEQANYGYVSQGASVTTLSPAALASIPTSSNVPSLLIRTDNAGIKLLSFGTALGFPDGATITSYVSAGNPVLTVSSSVYDKFALRRTASSIVRDDNGKLYVMQAGQRRPLNNTGLLNTTYAGVPITYLEGTTIADLPVGAPIN